MLTQSRWSVKLKAAILRDSCRDSYRNTDPFNHNFLWCDTLRAAATPNRLKLQVISFARYLSDHYTDCGADRHESG